MKLVKQSISNDSEISSPRRKQDDLFVKQQEFIYDQQSELLQQTLSPIPRDRFHCECTICNQLDGSTNNSIEKRPLRIKLHHTHEKDFVFVLKRILPTHRNSKSLNINIPDTVCFICGEPRFIVYNFRENGVSQIKVIRDKLSLNQIRQFMNLRRKKYADLLSPPTFKKIKILDPQETMLEKTREAVLVKYDDDNGHIMTEVEFLNLMMKRKEDPIWQKVQYVQNYVKQREFRLFTVKFKREEELYSPLFQRGSIEARQLCGDIVKGASSYISRQDEEEYQGYLKVNDQQSYLRYLSFKIIWYMECFYGARLEEGNFEWLLDDRNDYFLMNVFQIKYVEVEVTYTTEEMFYQDLERRAIKKLSMKPVHEKYSPNEKSAKWEKEMEKDYKEIQHNVGIDSNYFKIIIDNSSDQVFKQLHPQCKHQFREIIQNNSLYNKMKKQMLNSEKKHKPMLQSKMLNTFFLTPPKLKTSQFTTIQSKRELLQTINRFSNKRTAYSADRTVTSFKLDNSLLPYSRIKQAIVKKTNLYQNTHTLNQVLGLI